MADPFSIIVGTAGLLDVCYGVATYLVEVQAAAGKVEGDIAALSKEIESLILVNQSLELWAKEIQVLPSMSLADSRYIEKLWDNIRTILQGCRETVEKLDFLLRQIIGKKGHKVTGRVDGVRRVLRRQSKEKEFLQLRHQLSSYHNGLQLLLTTLSVSYTRISHNSINLSLRHMSEISQVLGIRSQPQIAPLQSVLALDRTNYLPGVTHSSVPRLSVDQYFGVPQLSPNLHVQGFIPKCPIPSSKPVPPTNASRRLHGSISPAVATSPIPFSENRHFFIPQPVSTIFTGRKTILRELKNALDDSSSLTHTQKRFVVYGPPGSGKTQLCCKFAEENNQKFWGVFSIDLRSIETAKHSFSTIAKIGGVEQNAQAAKHWLSNLEYPWLLLIDSADDQCICVEDFFPDGDQGLILVTTRDPSKKIHGTIGSGFYSLEKLRNDEAINLLLKTAQVPKPWENSTIDSASRIIEAFHSHPPALIHAGRGIANRLCSLNNYLNFYEGSWQMIRRYGKNYTNVYSTLEVTYRMLEASGDDKFRDAIDLLKIISFLHHENIRVDFLISAVTNPRRERAEAEKIRRQAVESTYPSKPWTKLIRERGVEILSIFLGQFQPAAVLPQILRDDETSVPFDGLRLRTALKYLEQMGLIIYNETHDSYSLHPLVHLWIRERPEMSRGEQAIWCGAASTILAQSILLPPLGSTEADEDLRRDLLPHVAHVRFWQQTIRRRINDNQQSRKLPWPVPAPSFDRWQATQWVKFSVVYLECGLLHEAETLQVAVREYICGFLGAEHPTTMSISLTLSNTYWQQSRTNEAAEIQSQVLQSCQQSLGPDHPKTLEAMDFLGVSRNFQGRYQEALDLHEKAFKGMAEALGQDHKNTLLAVDNLGRVMFNCFRYDEAKRLHLKAVEGMKRELGPTHMSTLNAMESLAMTYLKLGGPLLSPAHDIMAHVLEQRKKKLGREHPYTLQAIYILARIKSSLDQVDQAEELIRASLAVDTRYPRYVSPIPSYPCWNYKVMRSQRGYLEGLIDDRDDADDEY